MIERECDCAGRHLRFPEYRVNLMIESRFRPPPPPVPALHQHEDDRCDARHLGIGGCPGLPWCRDWIIGAHNIGITLAEATGNTQRAVEIRDQRDRLAREFQRTT